MYRGRMLRYVINFSKITLHNTYLMRAISIGLASLLLVGSLILAPLAFAESNNKGKSQGRDDDRKASVFAFPFGALGTTAAALHEQIKTLQETIKNLQSQRRALNDDDRGTTRPATTTRVERDTIRTEIKETRADIKDARAQLKFVRSLSRGMSGNDVRDLQELLAQYPDIFPSGLITGFFGRFTEEALKKFQKKFGIEAIGIFGPKTQAKLLALFVGRELPPGIIRRLGLLGSTTTPGAGVVAICHKPSGTSPQTLVIAVPALGAHLAHGDTVGVCPGSGAGTTTPPSPPPPPPDTTAPTLSAISASSTASTTGQVIWTTNEPATSKVWYGTSSPLTIGGSTANVSTTTLVTSHLLALSGLSASTTYQYAVESRDAAGNAATSSAQSFTTLQ